MSYISNITLFFAYCWLNLNLDASSFPLFLEFLSSVSISIITQIFYSLLTDHPNNQHNGPQKKSHKQPRCC